MARCKSTPWRSVIELPEVDESIGHTLVHYLYTGNYETLDLGHWSKELKAYKISVRSYCVARKYGLGGLVELAQKQVENISKGISIFDMLDIAREVYKKLPDDETWFAFYLKEEIKAAFKKDGELFTSGAFLKRVGGVKKLDKFLVKSIAEIYSDLLVSASKGVIEKQVRNTDGDLIFARLHILICSKMSPCAEKSLRAEEPVYAEDANKATGPNCTVPPVDSISDKELPFSEPVEASPGAGSSLDATPLSLGLPSTEIKSVKHEKPLKPKNKKVNKAKTTFSDWDDNSPEPEVLVAGSSDLSLNEPKFSSADVPSPKCAELLPNDPRVETVLASSSTGFNWAKVMENETSVPVVEASPVVEDSWYFPDTKNNKKGKKGKKQAQASLMAEAVTLAEPELDLSDGFTGDVGKDKNQEERGLTLPETEASSDPWGYWGSMAKKKSKKKKTSCWGDVNSVEG